MRHFAITGMDTAAMISRIFFGEAMRATPPSARICAGTRSSAMTETAPAFSAISAWRASVTSMMTPPLSISARPVLRRRLVELPLFWDIVGYLWNGEECIYFTVYSLGGGSRSKALRGPFCREIKPFNRKRAGRTQEKLHPPAADAVRDDYI